VSNLDLRSHPLFQFFLQSSNEARCLADQVELYYSRPSAKKLELLTKFTQAPAYFSHEDLISEMNNIQLQEQVNN